jgi:uncharacterized membrane protein
MSVRVSDTWRRHRHPVNIRHLGTGRTLGERVADGVAARVGSWPFIITQTVLLGVWIVGNAFLIADWLGGQPFDPYPFILLNLVLSFQAAYTGPVVLMSQNRQAARDRDEAEHDYKVNREALERLARLEEQQALIHQLLVRLAGETRPGTQVPGRAQPDTSPSGSSIPAALNTGGACGQEPSLSRLRQKAPPP